MSNHFITFNIGFFSDDLREYFSSYGNVVGHQIMLDRETGRSRGFGFVTFDSEDGVERVLSNGRMHELGGKQVSLMTFITSYALVQHNKATKQQFWKICRLR